MNPHRPHSRHWHRRQVAADAILLSFGETIDPPIHRKVMGCHDALRDRQVAGIRSLIPSYTSLLIRYDPLRWDADGLEALLAALCSEAPPPARSDDAPLLEIPVWYDPQVGWDLEAVAREHALEIEEVIALHSQQEYRVYAVGFLPGFGYLGRLDTRLETPRLPTPRMAVPAGSVAIADQQTAIYPAQSPGGWSILGRTPLTMFDPLRRPASLVEAGMRIRFVPIDRATYQTLGGVLP